MSDLFMERLVLVFSIVMVLGVTWLCVDALITLQSIDLVKVIGG